jgi:hypothetical protein
MNALQHQIMMKRIRNGEHHEIAYQKAIGKIKVSKKGGKDGTV